MRHKSRIAITIYSMKGKCYEAEDIGQEVFIRFYNSLDNFRGDSLLSTYLTRIAINLSLNEIKRRKVKRLFPFYKMVEDGADIADNKSSGKFDENKEIIQVALQKLNVKYRSVLVLRLIDGYSTEETVKILDLPLLLLDFF
jgi:RNA polymerase sigma-70 factor, ECF subfamily